MKQLKLFIVPTIIVPVIAVLLSGCMSYTVFRGGITTLPEKPLPDHIKSIVLVSRIDPPSDKYLSVTPGNLHITYAKLGLNKCLAGVRDSLNGSHFFKVYGDQNELVTPPSISFPSRISGTEIQAICKQFNADAVLSLELFTIQTDKDQTSVLAGWRVYNAQDTTIVDECKINRQGLTVDLEQIGAEIGYYYANRISPKAEMVFREYYGKQSTTLKNAKAFIKAKNWDAAKKIWESEASSTDKKIASRGNLNLGVYYEQQGDIDTALVFAQKACDLSENKHTTSYLRLLKMLKTQSAQ